MAVPNEQKTTYCFGLFEADTAAGELLRQGERIRLQDQPFRMLILLLQRAGEVISREELREQLWPDNTFVEFDNGLNVAVKKIRDALRDDADNPRFVETIPRRGYRFIAAVVVKNTADPLGQSPDPAIGLPPPAASPPTEKSRWKPWLVGSVVVVLGVAGFVVWKQAPAPKPILETASHVAGIEVAPRRALAVMEFQNVSENKEHAWLSTAIAEMLSTELAAGEKLHMVPGEDVARTKRELNLQSGGTLAREAAVRAGKILKVDILVVGSFTTIGSGPGGRLRLDVRLQDARNGEILTEAAQTGTTDHLFELISETGAHVRNHLGVPSLSPADSAAIRASTPVSPEAARLYAEGLSRMHLYDAAGARDLLMQAVAAEETFPLSRMALASAWRMLGYDSKARAEAHKALQLSSHLPRADRMRIEGRYHEMMGEMDQAISSYRALFALFPDSLEDGLALAGVQAWGGKPADSLATLDTLRRLPEPLSQDPRIDLGQERTLSIQGASGGLDFLHRAEEKARAQGASFMVAQARVRECSELLFTGHFDDAAQACEEARRVFSADGSMADSASAVRFLGDIRLRQGKLSEALEFFREALRIDQAARNDRGIAVSANEMALVYEQRGELSEAEKLYRKSYELFLKVGHPKNAGILASNVGGVLLQSGRLAEAEKYIRHSMTLAAASGAKDAEAGAHRTMAELALTRGDLAGARQHSDSAARIQIGDPVNDIADKDRLSRILAAQGDLAKARAVQLEAHALAEKIGAKGQSAQSDVALALLDLEEEKPVDAEQHLRSALAVFPGENMFDDDLTAHILLARCLLAQGKFTESQSALDEVRAAAEHSQNPARNIMFAIASARLKSAQVQRGGLDPVRTQLTKAELAAHKLGFVPLEYEAQLARGEAEMKINPKLGAKSLGQLETKARVHGLELLARKASAARTRT